MLHESSRSCRQQGRLLNVEMSRIRTCMRDHFDGLRLGTDPGFKFESTTSYAVSRPEPHCKTAPAAGSSSTALSAVRQTLQPSDPVVPQTPLRYPPSTSCVTFPPPPPPPPLSQRRRPRPPPIPTAAATAPQTTASHQNPQAQNSLKTCKGTTDRDRLFMAR
jgi:hypothetical protein